MRSLRAPTRPGGAWGHGGGVQEVALGASAVGGAGAAPTGSARGGVEERAAGLEQARELSGVDHGDRRPVLHAAARIEELELGHQLTRQVLADAIEAHERGVADQVK